MLEIKKKKSLFTLISLT